MPNCDVSRHKLLERPKKIAPHFLPRFQRMIRHFSILRVNPAENPAEILTELTIFCCGFAAFLNINPDKSTLVISFGEGWYRTRNITM